MLNCKCLSVYWIHENRKLNLIDDDTRGWVCF